MRDISKNLTSADLWLFGLAVVTILIILLQLPVMRGAYWVGNSDLKVTFSITDLDSGEAIPHATIRIHKSPSIGPPTDQEKDLVALTDADGKARQDYGKCMSYGYSGPFKETYHMELPDWHFRGSAEGYQPSEWIPQLKYGYTVDSPPQKGKPYATLTIPIKLQRVAAPVTH